MYLENSFSQKTIIKIMKNIFRIIFRNCSHTWFKQIVFQDRKHTHTYILWLDDSTTNLINLSINQPQPFPALKHLLI